MPSGAWKSLPIRLQCGDIECLQFDRSYVHLASAGQRRFSAAPFDLLVGRLEAVEMLFSRKQPFAGVLGSVLRDPWWSDGAQVALRGPQQSLQTRSERQPSIQSTTPQCSRRFTNLTIDVGVDLRWTPRIRLTAAARLQTSGSRASPSASVRGSGTCGSKQALASCARPPARCPGMRRHCVETRAGRSRFGVSRGS